MSGAIAGRRPAATSSAGGDRRDGDAGERFATFLPQVLVSTCLVALCPIAMVWCLRVCGILTSYVPGMLLGVGLSLLAARLGRGFWEARPGSKNLLFSELLIWGYVHRWYSQRRLASAKSLLGRASQAQQRIAGGLSPERQARLLEGLARRMDARDPGTHGHSRRVARYSWLVATRMGLPREQIARIRTAAAIHDIGKIETPTWILRKPGALTDEEYSVIKRHADEGADMSTVLKDRELTSIIRRHHERLDGSGYPNGLHGEEIPIGARIVAVADTFDAITANRSYRPARPHREALEIIRAEAGEKLDPNVVRAFEDVYSGRRPLTLWAWFTSLPERALSELGNGLASVASVAKVVAVAVLVGNVAASTASLTRAAHVRHRAVSAYVTPAVMASAADHIPVAAPLRPHPPEQPGGHRARRHASAPRSAGRAGVAPATTSAPATASAGEGAVASAGEGAAASGSSGEGGREGPGRSGESGKGGESRSTEQAHGHNQEAAHSGKSEEAAASGKGEEHAKSVAEERPGATASEEKGKSSAAEEKAQHEATPEGVKRESVNAGEKADANKP